MSYLKSSSGIFVFALVCAVIVSPAYGVTSKVIRHTGAADLSKGKTDNVVVSSEGTLQIGPSSELLAQKLKDAWTINTVVADPKGALYLGTSPNGVIFKYADGKLTKVYPADANSALLSASKKAAETNKPQDSNASAAQQYLTNEHIFAMAMDAGGRLLAGVSGRTCKLLRFDAKGDCRTVFEPNDTKYIFAVALDEVGNIYLGTGPKGKIYRLNPFGAKPEMIYESTDKNILSLAIGADGSVYAGSDERGLVYKIDPANKKAVVLYDAEQSDITSLLLDAEGNIYAAATSATPVKGAMPQTESPSGRPEIKSEVPAKRTSDGSVQVQVANIIKKPTEEEQTKLKAAITKTAPPSQASHVYKINKEGFVTDVFQESAVFFGLARQNNYLLLATGSSAQLLRIDPEAQTKEVLYKDEQASQITAVTVVGDDAYIGTANPAKLIKIEKSLAKEGTYTSALIDAGQPARWGKLQITADMPAKTFVKVSARTGNVSDVNDPTYSPWSAPRSVNEPVQLDVPQGRFCQYKLILNGSGKTTPVIREIAVPYMVPNLPPQVESVNVGADKAGIFKITYKATDRNNDKLLYQIDIRQIGRANWLKIKDDLETENFDWDSRTVEDGRYEIRVTASDKRSNTTTTAMEDSRISDPVVVDNTPPAIKSPVATVKDKTATIKFTAVDALSAIGSVSYTVDSDADWNGTLPDDLVYDTTSEDFTIVINKLEPGQHVIAVKVADAVGNTLYKTFEVEVK
jgi:sugar lactone lactonase YvrE